MYLVVRPPEFLDDVRERELEIAAAEARLAEVQGDGCPYCGFEVEKAFLRCPSCLRRLKEPCTVCGKPLDPRWKICPYCEAEVGQAPPEARPRRPRRATAGAARAAPPPQRQPSEATQARPPASRPTGGNSGDTGERPARQTRPPTAS